MPALDLDLFVQVWNESSCPTEAASALRRCGVEMTPQEAARMADCLRTLGFDELKQSGSDLTVEDVCLSDVEFLMAELRVRDGRVLRLDDAVTQMRHELRQVEQGHSRDYLMLAVVVASCLLALFR